MKNTEKTLKERIKEVFPDAKFDRHETDLYIKVIPGMWKWLKENYEFSSICRPFISAIDGTQWIDAPFAAWDEKYKN